MLLSNRNNIIAFRNLMLVLILTLLSLKTFSQITLYKNQFTTPLNPPGFNDNYTANSSNNYFSADQEYMYNLWNGTGTSIGTGSFENTYTVETIKITGKFGNAYSPVLASYPTPPAGQTGYITPNPSTYGDYAIGMLAGVQDDRLAIKLGSFNYPYINFAFDFSGIGLNAESSNVECTYYTDVTLAKEAPKMNVRFYYWNSTGTNPQFFETPSTGSTESTSNTIRTGWVEFSNNTYTGNLPSGNYTFNWSTASASIAVPVEAQGKPIAVMYNLLAGNNTNYAAIDNIRIMADNQPVSLPVVFDKLSATIVGNNLNINWSTTSEVNNSHYDVMASTDGVEFKKIGKINSKALNGNSSARIDYGFSMSMNSIMGASIMSILFLGIFSVRKRKLSYSAAFLIFAGILFASCKKSDAEVLVQPKRIFIKIIQVDIDGTSASSQVVQAVNE